MCERHLAATASYGTQVEAILTSYISTVIYSAFEAQARTIVATRAAGDGADSHLENFARTASIRLMRSIKISELAGAAAWFDPDCKRRFQEALDDVVKNAWDTIISNRHGLAHDDNLGGDITIISNLTFRELRELYPFAITVLDILSDAIKKN
jgi:hypothetical protein